MTAGSLNVRSGDRASFRPGLQSCRGDADTVWSIFIGAEIRPVPLRPHPLSTTSGLTSRDCLQKGRVGPSRSTKEIIGVPRVASGHARDTSAILVNSGRYIPRDHRHTHNCQSPSLRESRPADLSVRQLLPQHPSKCTEYLGTNKSTVFRTYCVPHPTHQSPFHLPCHAGSAQFATHARTAAAAPPCCRSG